MKTSVRTLLALGSAALALASCSKLNAINAPDPQPGSADFTTYAALGTSISAGYQSAQEKRPITLPAFNTASDWKAA